MKKPWFFSFISWPWLSFRLAGPAILLRLYKCGGMEARREQGNGGHIGHIGSILNKTMHACYWARTTI